MSYDDSDTTRSPREEVAEAFAQQLAVGLDPIRPERNRDTEVDLRVTPVAVNVMDGLEDDPEIEAQIGLIICPMRVAVEGYVRGSKPSPELNSLLVRVRSAAFSDRTLGGLLWGNLQREFEFEFFDGLELGPLVEWDVFRQVGSGDGGYFLQEFLLKYAIRSNDPSLLVRPDTL